MLKPILLGLAISAAGLSTASAASIYLDADSVPTGSTLDVAPLVTAFGTITFDGEVNNGADVDMTAAGASGFNFDIVTSLTPVTMSFDFAVSSISFLYGGNGGGFAAQVLNGLGVVVDSFTQVSTVDGQPAGPVTLFGSDIRELTWDDTESGWSYAAIDNVTIVPTVPVPAALPLLLTSLGGLGWAARRRKSA